MAKAAPVDPVVLGPAHRQRGVGQELEDVGQQEQENSRSRSEYK